MDEERKLTRSEIKRAAVLDAAREEFMRCGFRDANMDLIAEKADVSKRTVYNHYPSKEHLFAAIAADLINELHQATEMDYLRDRELGEQLRDFARVEVSFVSSETHIKIFRLFLVESFASPGMVEKILPPETLDQNPLIRWIQAAADDGRLQIDNAALASRELHSMLKGSFFWPAISGIADPPTGKLRESIIDSAVETFLSRYAC